jgi:hypothetical protein
VRLAFDGRSPPVERAKLRAAMRARCLSWAGPVLNDKVITRLHAGLYRASECSRGAHAGPGSPVPAASTPAGARRSKRARRPPVLIYTTIECAPELP